MVGRGRIAGAVIAFVAIGAAPGCLYVPPETVDLRTIRVAGEFGPSPLPAPTGTLRVVTESHDYAYGEHGIYALHEGYDIYDEHGVLLERVENHRTPVDERVTDVPLAAGRYFVAIPDGSRPELWIGIRIEDGRLTEADVTRRPRADESRS